MQKLTLLQILKHADLCTLLIKLTLSIQTNLKLNGASNFTTLQVMNEMEKEHYYNCQQMRKMVDERAGYALERHSYADGVLEAIDRTIEVRGEETMSKKDESSFVKLRKIPPAPLHRFLRLALDACDYTESQFMNKGEYIADIPADTPVTGLYRYINTRLLNSIMTCHDALKTVYLHASYSSRIAIDKGDIWKWILSSRQSIILFVNMVEADFHKSAINKIGADKVKIALTNRMVSEYNFIFCYFAKLLDPSIDIQEVLQNVEVRRLKPT